MKILHVITSLAPRSGGPTVVLKALSREQARQGHQVTVCTTNADNPCGRLAVVADRPVYENGVEIRYFPLNALTPLCFSLRLARWINHHLPEFDITHVHGLYRFPPTYAAWRSRMENVPYLIRPHGSLDPFLYEQSRYSLALKRLYECLFDRPNLNGANAVHYTSWKEFEKASFMKLRSRPVVVPNGIDWTPYDKLPEKGAFRRRLRVKKKTPLILFLGRINFKKGLDLLIPALARVIGKISNAHLAVIGPDNDAYGSKVKNWCRKHQVENNVYFEDFITPEETRQAYVDADVFVLPSYTENFGMTVVEAMACGCPVIISNQVNIWQEVRKAGAGLVVGLDSNELADAIIKILRDKAAASTMGQCGRYTAKKKCAWPNIVKQLTGVYQELIKNNAPSA